MCLMDDPNTPPFVRLGTTTVYLDGGVIDHNYGYEEEFTAPELTLFLHLVYQAYMSPYGYLPTRHLARSIYPTQHYDEMYDPEHAIEQHISNMRRKLGEQRRKPRYLVGRRNKGYKLCIQKGCCSAPVQLLRKLLEKLNKH